MEDVKKEESKQKTEDIQQIRSTEQSVLPEDASNKKNHMKIIVAFFLGILCVIAIAWFVQNKLSESSDMDTTNNTEVVIARVNKENITQQDIDERIQGASQILQAQGVNLSDPAVKLDIEKQMLEDTIGYLLLKQEAEKSSVTVDESEVQKQIDTYIQQAGTEENLKSQLQQAGLTLEVFKERIAEQLRIDAYLATVISVDDIVISDEEIQAFYTQVAASMGDTAPKLEEVKDQITQQLLDTKRNEKIQAHIDTLRTNAEIEYVTI